jgi:hypothetical protein
MLRAILAGLNAQAREWSETTVILDNGTLPNLEDEVENYRHLEYRRVREWTKANILMAFVDDMRHCRGNEEWLKQAKAAGIPTFVISSSHTDR